MSNSRKAEPQLYAPYFFHAFDLFMPTSERSLYTLRQTELNYVHYCNSKTHIRYRAFENSCITHNCLIVGQKYCITDSIYGKENDKVPDIRQRYRDTDIRECSLLLTINDEFGPHTTELLPQDRPATLGDMHRALQILHSCQAQASHPGDTSLLGIAIADFEERQRALYVKAWGRPA